MSERVVPQRKVDWAERKANQFDWLDHDSIVQIAHALRLERARAVRMCQRLKANEHRDFEQTNPYTGVKYNLYTKACDDCASAIKGKL